MHIKKVASWAPFLVFILELAQFPKALDPPERFISTTIIPRTTKKIKIPELPEIALINPSWTRLFKKMLMDPPDDKIAPVTIPKNKEEKTSLVNNATKIATKGGKRDQALASVTPPVVAIYIASPRDSNAIARAGFNFYSILTLFFVVSIIAFDNDFGPMKKYEKRAMEEGYLGISKDNNVSDLGQNLNGSVIDLVFPVLILIISCVISLINVGGFFDLEGPYYHDFVNAFANTDSSVALAMGSLIALTIIIGFFVVKKSISFEKSMDAISEGFSSMVAAILILTMATSLKNISNDLLGSTQYVGGLMENVAGSLNSFLPVVIFIVAIFLAFATGTSWGTFGILIPIVVSMFEPTDPIFFIGISATLSGAVCGDHLSPISDTTIMSSTGAGCIHIDHVKTQLPYGMSVAAISIAAYIIAGFTHSALIPLSFGAIVIFVLMYVLKLKNKKELSL